MVVAGNMFPRLKYDFPNNFKFEEIRLPKMPAVPNPGKPVSRPGVYPYYSVVTTLA